MIGGIAGRYAIALFDLAKDADALTAVEEDLKGLGSLIAESDALKRLLSSPLFSREQQEKALGEVLARAGAHGLTQNFIGLVARNRRLFVLDDMVRAFMALMAEQRGEIVASVTSARTLSDAQRADVAAALKAALGQDVNLDLAVDPDLIGGLVVKVGSRMVDSSIRTKLNTLKIQMKEAG